MKVPKWWLVPFSWSLMINHERASWIWTGLLMKGTSVLMYVMEECFKQMFCSAGRAVESHCTEILNQVSLSIRASIHPNLQHLAMPSLPPELLTGATRGNREKNKTVSSNLYGFKLFTQLNLNLGNPKLLENNFNKLSLTSMK